VTIQGTIDLENSSALLALDDLRRQQLPFAQALALTRTAQAAQAEIKRELPSRFTLRNSFVERGVRVQAASKRTQEAAVFWRSPGGASRRGFAERLAIQETGGSVSPISKTIPIPRGVKRGAGGTIPKSRRPARLLDRPKVFIQDVNGKGAVILQRVGRAAPRLLYFLSQKTSRFRPRFEFKATAERVARREYRREFGRAFAKALATRRR